MSDATCPHCGETIGPNDPGHGCKSSSAPTMPPPASNGSEPQSNARPTPAVQTARIAILVSKDMANGDLHTDVQHESISIDLLYEAFKAMVVHLSKAANHIQDPLTRSATLDMMNSCKLVVKGGEAALNEQRAKLARLG